ncbi:hypothetical protein QEW_0748 [Clostridioides difficile CD160]|nr:hypothetical protein QEW_0748 [Clostridioides difficile CD160]
MENKILELLQEMQGSIKEMQGSIKGIQGEIKGINTRLDGMEHDIKDLKTGQVETNNRLDIVESQLNENTQILKALEHKADVSKAEHDKMSFDILHIQGDISEIKQDLNATQIITSKNWSDIEKLKSIK